MSNYKDYLENKELNKIQIYTRLYQEYLTPDKKDAMGLFREIIGAYRYWKGNGVKLNEEENDYVMILENAYLETLQQLVYTLTRRNYDEGTFYEKLYILIFKSDLFPQSYKDGGILLYLLINKVKGIVYYKAEEIVDLNDEKYKESIDRIVEKLDKALSMLDNRFDTKYLLGAQLKGIADTIDLEQDKSVFWGVVIGMVKKMERELLKNRK